MKNTINIDDETIPTFIRIVPGIVFEQFYLIKKYIYMFHFNKISKFLFMTKSYIIFFFFFCNRLAPQFYLIC